MNYAAFRAIAASQIKAAGLTVSFSRAGVVIASSYAIQTDTKEADDSSTLLAQTAATTKTYLVASTADSIRAGDLMQVDAATFTVNSVKEIKPAGVLILTEVEVV